MYGAIDQVEGMVQRIILETNEKYQIILTGGFSILISENPNFKRNNNIYKRYHFIFTYIKSKVIGIDFYRHKIKKRNHKNTF